MGPAPAVAATRAAVRPLLGGPVLVACSGGPDSVALAAAVAFEAPRAGVSWTLVTVDHGLQSGSAEQAERVTALGRALNAGRAYASSVTIRVEVGRVGGPEAAARDARYAALRRAAGTARVMLGHTRDDQAESVLLGLGRGSGPRSIAGMRAVDDIWLRPFLGLSRATTEAACAAQGLPTWDDPMNSDPRYTRVRLRREVLPLLEDVLAGGVAAALARTADLLRDDLDALDAWADAAYRASDGGADVAALAPLPRAVRSRVLRRRAAECGAGPLTAEHTAVLDALVVAWHGQGPVALPGGVHATRVSGRLVIAPDTDLGTDTAGGQRAPQE